MTLVLVEVVALEETVATEAVGGTVRMVKQEEMVASEVVQAMVGMEE